MFELGGIQSQLQQELEKVRAAEPGAAPASQWVALVGACQKLINTAAAMQTVALAQVAATDEVEDEDGTSREVFRGLGHQRLDAPAMVHDLLGLSAAGATGRLAAAVDLATRHPLLLQAMASGRLDGYRAGVLAEELTDADAEVCAEVAARLEPHLRAEAGGALRRRARRVLASVDPELLRAKAERARGERSLRRHTGAPGVDEWSARVPVESSRTAWSVVDDLARRYVADGRCTGIEEARADALMDLIHARATGGLTVQLAVPASQVLAPSEPAAGEELVPVAGFGMPGVTHVRRSWLAAVIGIQRGGSERTGIRQASPGPAGAGHGDVAEHAALAVPTRVVVAACDSSTGVLLAQLAMDTDPVQLNRAARRAANRAARLAAQQRSRRPGRNSAGHPGEQQLPGPYRPPEWLRDFVRARDGHCRFPGCAINARFCDVDHVVPWPHGPTAAANLVCLCRRHHRIKQRRGWHARLHSDATMTWTDPTGREGTTTPVDFLDLEQPPPRRQEAAHAGPTPASESKVQPSHDPPVPRLPTRLEEALDDTADARLADLACRPGLITARNRTALRLGRAISTRHAADVITAPVRLGLRRDLHRATLPFRVDDTYPPGHTPAARRAKRHPDGRAPRPGDDDPPPF